MISLMAYHTVFFFSYLAYYEILIKGKKMRTCVECVIDLKDGCSVFTGVEYTDELILNVFKNNIDLVICNIEKLYYNYMPRKIGNITDIKVIKISNNNITLSCTLVSCLDINMVNKELKFGFLFDTSKKMNNLTYKDFTYTYFYLIDKELEELLLNARNKKLIVKNSNNEEINSSILEFDDLFNKHKRVNND